MTVARFTGYNIICSVILGLAPQALCLHLLRRLTKTENVVGQVGGWVGEMLRPVENDVADNMSGIGGYIGNDGLNVGAYPFRGIRSEAASFISDRHVPIVRNV